MVETLLLRQTKRRRARKLARFYGILTVFVFSVYFCAGFFLHPLFLVSDVREKIRAVSLTNELSPLATDAEKDQDLAKDIEAVDYDVAQAYFDEDIRYLVTKKSKSGFTIFLNKKAPRELEFSWVALAVKGGKTFHSEAVKESTGNVKDISVAPIEMTSSELEVSPSDSVTNPATGDIPVGDTLIDSPVISDPVAPSE